MTAAERVAATVAQGVHGRRRVGRGDAFWQFRPYQPGDSAQAIDWRQTAKSTRAFVRESEWEAAQSVWIWCDRSPSMRFGSDARWPEKRDRAAVLTLALTLLLVRGGERVAALGSRAAPGGGRAVVDRIAGALLRPDGAGESLPALEALPRHARLVLIGDMLAPVPETARFVRETAAMGVDGYILQIVDPAEAALPYRGRVRFDGTEDEGRVTIGRVESVRADYLAALGAHRARPRRARPVGPLGLRRARDRHPPADRAARPPRRARRRAGPSRLPPGRGEVGRGVRRADAGRARLRVALAAAGRARPSRDLVAAAHHPARAADGPVPAGAAAPRPPLARGTAGADAALAHGPADAAGRPGRPRAGRAGGRPGRRAARFGAAGPGRRQRLGRGAGLAGAPGGLGRAARPRRPRGPAGADRPDGAGPARPAGRVLGPPAPRRRPRAPPRRPAGPLGGRLPGRSRSRRLGGSRRLPPMWSGCPTASTTNGPAPSPSACRASGAST